MWHISVAHDTKWHISVAHEAYVTLEWLTRPSDISVAHDAKWHISVAHDAQCDILVWLTRPRWH